MTYGKSMITIYGLSTTELGPYLLSHVQFVLAQELGLVGYLLLEHLDGCQPGSSQLLVLLQDRTPHVPHVPVDKIMGFNLGKSHRNLPLCILNLRQKNGAQIRSLIIQYLSLSLLNII